MKEILNRIENLPFYDEPTKWELGYLYEWIDELKLEDTK